MKRNITIKDVARRAGVSTTVVSVALSNKTSNVRMSPETREQIRRIAEECNYHPDLTARGFHSRKSYLLGLFFSIQSWYVLTRLLQSIRKVCYDYDYDLIIYPADSLEEEKHNLRIAQNRNLDGILTSPFVSDEGDNLADYRDFAANGVPITQFFYKLSDEFPYVGRNYYEIGFSAVRQFVKHGHRRIGLFVFENYQDEKQGFSSFHLARGCRDAAEKFSVELFFYPAFFSEETLRSAGTECAKAVLAAPKRPTAVVTSTDFLAYNAINHFRAHGLRIPEDISVVACADIMDSSRMPLPELSCFKISAEKVGSEAAKKCLGLPDAFKGKELLIDEKIADMVTIRKIGINEIKGKGG